MLSAMYEMILSLALAVLLYPTDTEAGAALGRARGSAGARATSNRIWRGTYRLILSLALYSSCAPAAHSLLAKSALDALIILFL